MRNTALPVALITSLLLPLSLTAKAESQFSIEPSLLHFDYTEFSITGSVLDKETGWIPGVQLQIDTSLNEQWTLGLELSAYDGNVDYNGQTQAGAPYTTSTDETLFRFGAHIKTPLSTYTSLVVGAKYNEWERNVNGNNGVLGLLEIYRWWELSAGTAIELWKKDTQSWQAEATVFRTIRPTIHVDLSSANFGKTDLNLGTDWGGRIQFAWAQQKASNWQYGFNIFYEVWDFGRSGSKATSGGINSVFVSEPRSETRHSGVRLLAGFKY